MVVAVRLGLLEHHGKVRTPEGTFEVRRGEDGWFVVPGPASEASGRVRYDEEREVVEIEHGGAQFSIRFAPGSQTTRFELAGHAYDLGRIDFGEITIKEGTRVAARGHATLSGLRLTLVAADLEPLERELAFGLALRSSGLDEEFWREDHPFLEQVGQGTEGAWTHYEDERAR